MIVEMPGIHADTRSTNMLELMELRTPQRSVYRKVVVERDRSSVYQDPTLFPGYAQPVMQLGFSVTFDQYKHPTESIAVRAYAGDPQAGEAIYPVIDVVYKERVEQLKIKR